jgi:S-formylglutathione hydrolase
VKAGKATKLPILIDYASHDQFAGELLVENLVDALTSADYEHEAQCQEGYQHSFYFVSSFLGKHFDFHAKYLDWYA